MEKLIERFNEIRDLEYGIPLFFGEETYNCSSKSMLLKKFLEENWYKINFRVCNFYWEDLKLPEEILKIQHTKKSMHVYLEAEINWNIIILDSTWDIWLKNIFNIPFWDWISSTEIAVKEISRFSLIDSKNIMENINKEEVEEHLEYNREFYRSINEYLGRMRR